MTSDRLKKGISVYILPILFCGLLIVLALLRNDTKEPAAVREIQASEPLTLTDLAVENYLYADGFSLDGGMLLDASGKEAGTLAVTKDESGEIGAITLTFPLPTYVQTKNSESLTSLKEAHDDGAQRGEAMFLSLFDAIAATDGRVAARRDSALEKLRQTMDTGKASAQAANSWRFSFSLEPGEIEGTVTVLFEKVK